MGDGMRREGLSFAVILILVSLMSGCMNIGLRLQPEDTSVKEALIGLDCVRIIVGFGFGTATIERAQADTRVFGGTTDGPKAMPITKIRRAELQDVTLLMFGSRCIEVVGE
jgi:hypothetical protein